MFCFYDNLQYVIASSGRLAVHLVVSVSYWHLKYPTRVTLSGFSNGV